jgi:excisionase family DNA binding protein
MSDEHGLVTMSVEEAAAKLGMSKRTMMERIIKRGLITTYRVSPAKIRIAEVDLAQYLRSCCMKGRR